MENWQKKISVEKKCLIHTTMSALRLNFGRKNGVRILQPKPQRKQSRGLCHTSHFKGFGYAVGENIYRPMRAGIYDGRPAKLKCDF